MHGLFLETVLILSDKFVKHDLNEYNLYHDLHSFSKEFIIDVSIAGILI